jgi:hypothetical protein
MLARVGKEALDFEANAFAAASGSNLSGCRVTFKPGLALASQGWPAWKP